MLLERNITEKIVKYFWDIPVTAIIGARQVGKSTLANQLISNQGNAIYLDLETRADLQVLDDPIAFLSRNKSKLFCFDEIQLKTLSMFLMIGITFITELQKGMNLTLF